MKSPTSSPNEDVLDTPAERFRSPESYIHWERGAAIVAGMIGIIGVFLFLFVSLPIREERERPSLTGLGAAAPTVVAATATVRPTVVAATGPDQPKVSATVRQFPFVRRSPGINFAVITNLKQGDKVDIVGRSPDRQWFQIILPDQTRDRGWVAQEFLQPESDTFALPEVRE